VLNAVDFGTVTVQINQFVTGDPTVINFSTAPTGGAGTFTYQWYYQDGLVHALLVRYQWMVGYPKCNQ
jgi:hypothetical protein